MLSGYIHPDSQNKGEKIENGMQVALEMYLPTEEVEWEYHVTGPMELLQPHNQLTSYEKASNLQQLKYQRWKHSKSDGLRIPNCTN